MQINRILQKCLIIIFTISILIFLYFFVNTSAEAQFSYPGSLYYGLGGYSYTGRPNVYYGTTGIPGIPLGSVFSGGIYGGGIYGLSGLGGLYGLYGGGLYGGILGLYGSGLGLYGGLSGVGLYGGLYGGGLLGGLYGGLYGSLGGLYGGGLLGGLYGIGLYGGGLLGLSGLYGGLLGSLGLGGLEPCIRGPHY